MRVLVTGVSGLIGRSAAARLAGAGHEVIGMSRTRPLEMPPGVAFVAGDVRDEVKLAEVMAGVDTVLHCAYMLDARAGLDAMWDTNVGGMKKVIASAEAAGVTRFVFMSSVMAYGPRSSHDQAPSREDVALTPHPDHAYAVQKAECEELLARSPISSVSVRAGIVLGRGTDNRLQETLAAPFHIVPRGDPYPWQLIHHDDLARFLTIACSADLTGPVNIGVDDLVDQRDIALRLGRRPLPVPPKAMISIAGVVGSFIGITAGEVAGAMRLPIGDTTVLREKWGFEPSWSGVNLVEDTRLAVVGRKTKRARMTRETGRTPYLHQILPGDAPSLDGTPLEFSVPEDLRGEFDTPLDPRFPVYSQTGLAEVLPGPSSVLTLSTQARALRGSASAVAELLGLAGTLHTEASARLQGVHAHRVFINATASYHVAVSMPGSNPEAMARQFTGGHASELPGGEEAVKGSFIVPAKSLAKSVLGAARVGRQVLGLVRGLGKDVVEVKNQTARLEEFLGDLEHLPSQRLEDAILLGRDLLAYAWTVQGLVDLVGSAALQGASKRSGTAERGFGDELASSARLRGVRQLAATAAADPAVLALLTTRTPGLSARVEAEAPEFWLQVQVALHTFGQRGPGEAEFDTYSFADDVDGFLTIIGRAATTVTDDPTDGSSPVGRRSFLQGLAARLLVQRENNRDLCVRLTWIERRLVLEHGRRLTEQGRIERPRDVVNLTVEELIDPPQNARELIDRRKSERERLARMHMPPAFSARCNERSD